MLGERCAALIRGQICNGGYVDGSQEVSSGFIVASCYTPEAIEATEGALDNVDFL